jgi:ComF family protein
MVDGLRRLVATPRCLLCAGRSEALICQGCRNDLPWNRCACPLCARPLAAPEMALCAACIRKPPPFDAAIAAFRYAEPVDRAVQRLKYGADFLAARWLGEALADVAGTRRPSSPDLLIPMPLHSGRLRRRGYNQAQEIARTVAQRTGIALHPQLAHRIRATDDQIGKTAVQRRRNVRDAFAVDAAVCGHRLALIDDVMTTGSTLSELARVCRQAGAKSVEAWAVARAE